MLKSLAGLIFASLALISLFTAPSLAQEGKPTQATAPAIIKDPGTAIVFSLLVPGGGQIYAGKPGKGTFILLGSVGALALGAASSSQTCTLYSCAQDNTGLQLGAAAALVLWGYSMFTAGADVREYNSKISELAKRISYIRLTHSERITGLSIILPLN